MRSASFWSCRRAARQLQINCRSSFPLRQTHTADGLLRCLRREPVHRLRPLGRDEARLEVLRHRPPVAPRWIAEAAAAGGQDDEALARRDRLKTFAFEATAALE